METDNFLLSNNLSRTMHYYTIQYTPQYNIMRLKNIIYYENKYNNIVLSKYKLQKVISYINIVTLICYTKRLG